MQHILNWADRNSHLGVLVLRLFVGLRLIQGVIDNIVDWDRMIEFRNFLATFGFPFPLFCAILSVYAQFICGILILAGWKIRYAAIVMIINFSVAWIMVDRLGTVAQMTPALAMLFCSVLFFFQGAGKFSIDRK